MRYIRFLKLSFFILMVIVITISCSDTYTPKPRGYFRIEFPKHEYKTFDEKVPFSFEIPIYSHMVLDSSQMTEPYWYNLEFPSMKGKIHLSYKNVKGNLSKYMEDSRTLAYKHTIKADDILDHPFLDHKNKVYGILYEIKGNAASSFQFFATDSSQHFLRGSLYFNVYPNKDSLAPVFDFIKVDIKHLIESIRWKE
jgi:gliding motility-associated lipoprotein GldD